MTDPALIDVDESMIYVRLEGYTSGVTSIPHPDADDGPRDWAGAEAEIRKGKQGPDSRLKVSQAKRGSGWNLLYVETDDEELADALVDAGHERLAPDEFAAALESAPDLIYLKVTGSQAANRALKTKGVERIAPDEIPDYESDFEFNRNQE